MKVSILRPSLIRSSRSSIQTPCNLPLLSDPSASMQAVIWYVVRSTTKPTITIHIPAYALKHKPTCRVRGRGRRRGRGRGRGKWPSLSLISARPPTRIMRPQVPLLSLCRTCYLRLHPLQSRKDAQSEDLRCRIFNFQRERRYVPRLPRS